MEGFGGNLQKCEGYQFGIYFRRLLYTALRVSGDSASVEPWNLYSAP